MTISKFAGKNEFLSNFYHYPMIIGYQLFDTVEHAFQAYKTLDLEWRENIRNAHTPRLAKNLGKIAPLRPNWEDDKVKLMRDIIAIKFTKGTELGHRLVGTGSEILVEGNTWHDQFWGSCTCPDHINDPGHNALGKVLMQQRSRIE